jgi:AhpD family alkylhydroperoxidase
LEGEMAEPREANRILPLDPQRASGKARGLFEQVRVRLGLVPNPFRVLANAPVALEGYLNFSVALAGGTLDGRLRERIALAVAESNLCSYCLSAHAFLGRQAGLRPDEIADAIRASAADPHTDAVLKLVRAIVVQRGEVSDSDL